MDSIHDSVQFSHLVVLDSLRPHGLQHARFPCPSPTPRACSNSCASNHLILGCPLLLLPSIFPSIRSFPMSQFFTSGSQSIGVSDSASVLPMNTQSFQWTHRTNLLEDGLVESPCSPRDSQESSPTPGFKNISSSVLSFLYSPTLIFIHDYWKNHSLD